LAAVWLDREYSRDQGGTERKRNGDDRTESARKKEERRPAIDLSYTRGILRPDRRPGGVSVSATMTH
jgi:hypothetical protein